MLLEFSKDHQFTSKSSNKFSKTTEIEKTAARG